LVQLKRYIRKIIGGRLLVSFHTSKLFEVGDSARFWKQKEFYNQEREREKERKRERERERERYIRFTI